ncbi:hypothetical protein KUCAC02_025069, partial [Chaenocephalus aceratus]
IDCQDGREEKPGEINSLIHTQLCEAPRIDLMQIAKQKRAVGARQSYFPTRCCPEECIVLSSDEPAHICQPDSTRPEFKHPNGELSTNTWADPVCDKKAKGSPI